MSKGFGTLKPRTGGNDSVRVNEVVEIFTLPDNEDVVARFLPTPILPVKQHWIKIYAGKERKEIKIPKYCIAFDPENEDTPKDGVECPYCTLSQGQQGSCQTSIFYYANAIIRELQDDEPAKKIKPTDQEKKTGFKDIKSKTWTPVRVLRITNTVASRLQELGQRNIVKDKKGNKVAYDVTHPKYGTDIILRYKPKASGTEKYSCDKDTRSTLTEDEENYLVWDLSTKLLEVTGLENQKQADESFNRLEIVGNEDIDDDGKSFDKKKKRRDEDEDDEPKKKKKGKSKSRDEDEDDEPKSKKKEKKKKRQDDDDLTDDDDDPFGENPKKKKGKSKSRDEDDDDDDEPKKKKKGKSNYDFDLDDEPKSKKKKRRNDEDDEDEPKKKKKGKSKSRDEDDNDDDEHKSKKKTKKKKRRDDDDDIPF